MNESTSQFKLLKQRRFAPFFWTQFFGAGNDNLFKFAFTMLVTYQLKISWMPPEIAGLVIGSLFILPFLLFSATCGQLTDKFDKALMIRLIKNLEIGIMSLAAIGFYYQNIPLLLICTFLMGLHSTLFGPVKFAYLPQVLSERELTGGNGMVEMGTFAAILLGNVAGGLLISKVGVIAVAISCFVLAIIGRLVAQEIDKSPAADPELKINWNPLSETWKNLKLANENIAVFRSLLGISWMWFFGAIFLSQFPSFAKDVLHGNEEVASLLLIVFSIGIGTGSLLCEKLSHHHVEIGLVPLGAIGMSIFSIDLYFASNNLSQPLVVHNVSEFLSHMKHWRILMDLSLLSLFAGLYSVPMYALIQIRSQPTHRARIVAANNILNALFMIISSIMAGLLLKNNFTIPEIFLITAILNIMVATHIFMIVPEYLLRFMSWVLCNIVYKFKVTGEENIPASGPAILVCNHVSYLDAILLMAASPRPIRFVIDNRNLNNKLIGFIFKLVKVILITFKNENKLVYDVSFGVVIDALKDDEILAFFPEGGLTSDGKIHEYQNEIVKIIEDLKKLDISVPVIPTALTDLWGSAFSHHVKNNEMELSLSSSLNHGLFDKINLNIGSPMNFNEVNIDSLKLKILELSCSR